MAESDKDAVNAEWDEIKGLITREVVARVEMSENRDALLPLAHELLYVRALRKARKANLLPQEQATTS